MQPVTSPNSTTDPPPTELHLGADLALPLDVLTGTTGVVGQRGTGKTSTAVVLVEEAAAAGAHFAVIDPTGAWHGLRSNAAGDGPGLECIVLGGEHADLPLEATSGALVAELVVDERLSVVLDVSLLEHGDQVRFVAEFAGELFHRNRSSLLLVLDEAHIFIPEARYEPSGYAAKCRGALNRVVTLGRRKGLGCVLISQRPAAVAKSVLEQAEVLVAHRLKGANDRKAIKGWLDSVSDSSAAVLEELPKLERGRAVVHAPTVGVDGVFAIRPKSTFDSSATPEVGAEAAAGPRVRAEVDLGALSARMAETIERAEQDDPERLRARIRDLERAIVDGVASDHLLAVESELEQIAERLDVGPLGQGAVLFAVEQVLRDRQGLLKRVSCGTDAVQTALFALVDPDFAPPTQLAPGTENPPAPRPVAAEPTPAPNQGVGAAASAPEPAGEQEVNLKAGARRMLDVLGAYFRFAPDGMSRRDVGVLSGVSPAGGTFGTYLGVLRRAGLIEDEELGVSPTRRGLDFWKSNGELRRPYLPSEAVAEIEKAFKLKAGERAMLALAMKHRSEGLTRKQLGTLANVSPSGGTFGTYLGHLRRLGLVEERGKRVYPGAVLYLGEGA